MESLEQIFINEQSDFFNYLKENQVFKREKTYRDYITRLSYVSHFFRLDGSFTDNDVRSILDYLTETMHNRDRYNTPKTIGDIASGLKKFLEYVKSDYKKKISDSILKDVRIVEQDSTISTTEKEALVKARIGQGVFRQQLFELWHGCSVTECKTQAILIASHIRPWRQSDNIQRLDVYNGLLLIPNLDKLFDRGYISFRDDGRIIKSSFLPPREYELLGVSDNMRLKSLNDRHFPYLKYHRDNCLL